MKRRRSQTTRVSKRKALKKRRTKSQPYRVVLRKSKSPSNVIIAENLDTCVDNAQNPLNKVKIEAGEADTIQEEVIKEDTIIIIGEVAIEGEALGEGAVAEEEVTAAAVTVMVTTIAAVSLHQLTLGNPITFNSQVTDPLDIRQFST